MNLWDRMGLAGKRVLILHHDDLGLTHAANEAYRCLGYPSGSILAAGSWAPELAGTPGADFGVHLTLNSEWSAPRLRPLTGGASLRDAQGYLWPTLEEVWAHVTTDDAEAELRAQIEAVRLLGIDITHIDTHMGSIMRPDLAQIYLRLAMEYRLPAMLPDSLDDPRLPGEWIPQLREVIDASPLPRVRLVSANGVPTQELAGWYVQTLRDLGPGVYHLYHHAARPTPEGLALPDGDRRRVDVMTWQDAAVRDLIGEYRLLTYREVRDALRRVWGQDRAIAPDSTT